MGSYRFGDKDRERLGCPEWLPFDLLDASLADVTELAERFGFSIAEWPDPILGPVDMATVGVEGQLPARKHPEWSTQATVWLILRTNGCQVTWDDAARVAFMRLEYRSDETPAKARGKGRSRAASSGATSTTQPSSTSSLD